MSSAMAPSECHGSNYKWDNGIFTPSFNREGEVASIPLPQREEQRQAFSKERGAGKQGGTDNHQSRGKVRQVSGQVPHYQQVHSTAPVRQVEDSEDQADQQPIHQVSGSDMVAKMELSCTKGGCQFVTPNMELAFALEYMQMHLFQGSK